MPIWLDEISDITDWQSEFTKPEAKEVVEAIGAWIFCFTDDHTPTCDRNLDDSLRAVQAIIEYHTEGVNDAVMLAIAVSPENKSTAMNEDRFNALEDIAMRYSFELIDYAADGINDYGEKQGLDRVKEALQANEWTSLETGDNEPDLDAESDLDFGEAEMQTALSDLKTRLVDNAVSSAQTDQLEGEGQADAVDDLEVMLGKLLAVKEQSSDLPLAQRKRIAAQAVRDIMQAAPS